MASVHEQLVAYGVAERLLIAEAVNPCNGPVLRKLLPGPKSLSALLEIRQVPAAARSHLSAPDLLRTVEADARETLEDRLVLDSGLQPAWIRDLPLCFPGRACVDVPPGGAQAMYLISDLTSSSPGIAAALWAGFGVSIVLIGIGLRLQWRGDGLRPWLVVLAITLLIGGVAVSWLMNGWLGEAGLVYGGLDERPAEATPSSIVGSWPLVQSAAHFAIALGVLALFLMLNTTAIRQRRFVQMQKTNHDTTSKRSARESANPTS